jgi:hypothetical protein
MCLPNNPRGHGYMKVTDEQIKAELDFLDRIAFEKLPSSLAPKHPPMKNIHRSPVIRQTLRCPSLSQLDGERQ